MKNRFPYIPVAPTHISLKGYVPDPACLLLVLLGALLYPAIVSAQNADSGYTKQTVSETDIQAVFSYYTQDGTHSAVTGGTGTEDLQVYSPDFSIQHTRDSTHAFYADFGVDVISSASTDNIDFHMSSASSLDARGHISLGYGHTFSDPDIEAGIKGSLSIESDYFSRGFDLWGNWSGAQKQFNASFRLQAYFDDLRWGRLNPGYLAPVKLIYPEELRYKEWEDEHNRTSFNASLGFSHVINRRLVFGLFPGIAYQYGLLSTPFHRVYFQETGEARVEHLPDNRLKVPVGMQLNAFLGRQWILRSYYRFYWDDFGLVAHTGNLEGICKISPYVSLSGFGRYYTQSGIDYFRPFREHDVSAEFYTSDYDLSDFHSLEAGIGFTYRPLSGLFSGFLFREVALRYGYYHREDGLYSHVFSTSFNFRKRKE